MTHAMAVIGYGGMGSWHVENVSSRIPQMKVKGVFDVREEAKKKAQDHGLYVYQTVEELLADPEVEVVTVATPNNFHKDYIIRCLEAGKHVISEKPVTMNAKELSEAMETAEKTGKIFSIHQNRRWDRDYVTIKKLLNEGTVGEPYFIESRVQGSRGAMYGWRGHKVNGGGMVLDWGVHLIDQLMDLIDSPVVSVDSHLFSLYSDEVDDNIKIFLRFENGVSAICEMSTNCLIQDFRWHVSCTEGTIAIDDFACHGKVVQLKENAEMEWADDIVYTEAGPTRTMAPRPEFTTITSELPAVDSDWCDYYKNIAAVIEGEEELVVKPEQALRVMRVIDLVFRAQEEGHGLSCRI